MRLACFPLEHAARATRRQGTRVDLRLPRRAWDFPFLLCPNLLACSYASAICSGL